MLCVFTGSPDKRPEREREREPPGDGAASRHKEGKERDKVRRGVRGMCLPWWLPHGGLCLGLNAQRQGPSRYLCSTPGLLQLRTHTQSPAGATAACCPLQDKERGERDKSEKKRDKKDKDKDRDKSDRKEKDKDKVHVVTACNKMCMYAALALPAC